MSNEEEKPQHYRQQAYIERMKAAGLVRVSVYVPAADKDAWLAKHRKVVRAHLKKVGYDSDG